MNKYFFELLILLSASISSGATAHDSCYQFRVANRPEGAEIPLPPWRTQTETWCYRNLVHPAGSVYLYNADNEVARPELAAVRTSDGILIHGSLLKGEMTIHRVQVGSFNPYSVPLTEPKNSRDLGLVLIQRSNVKFIESVNEVLNKLLTEASPVVDLRIQPGVFFSVPDSALPWRGFWWPYANSPLARNADSPLGKFDSFVQSSGSSSEARAWENQHHIYRGVGWEGHCNGWAASSILRSEPRVSRYDARSGVTFSVADQKGILAEKDYCVKTAFFGHRFPDGGSQDITPEIFHKTLTYYIGQLGKPVAIDVDPGTPVMNNIISGYQVSITRTAPNLLSVVMTATIHSYDSSLYLSPGVAPSHTRTYRYSLNTNSAGLVTSGSWTSANPDFLWVPLSPATCTYNNPNVTESSTLGILRLPQAQ